MNTRNFLRGICIALITAGPLRGQVNSSQAAAPDSQAAIKSRAETAARDQRRYLDSLAAGRRRWSRAKVLEYRIQAHTSCFCMYTKAYLDSMRPLSLITVRAGGIVGYSPGKTLFEPGNQWTIDTLFARVESDAAQEQRVITRFRLDPRYGFPTEYRAETPLWPDAWIQIQVDSFAVVSPTPADAVVIGGKTLRLQVYLDRDFMPSTEPHTGPVAIIRLVPDSGAVPNGVTVERAIFSLGSSTWNVVPQKEFENPDHLEVVARRGPMWPVGSKVGVVVQVRDATGKSYSMRLSEVIITRSD